MATIVNKYTTTAYKRPLAAQLSVGELAVDVSTGAVYTKSSSNAVLPITDVVKFPYHTIGSTDILDASAVKVATLTKSITAGTNNILVKLFTLTAIANPIIVYNQVEVAGSSSVESIYVAKGAFAKATSLSGGIDFVYLPGTYASYTFSVAGTTITASRLVDSNRFEGASIAAGSSLAYDKLVFTNGYVKSFELKAAIDAATPYAATVYTDVVTPEVYPETLSGLYVIGSSAGLI